MTIKALNPKDETSEDFDLPNWRSWVTGYLISVVIVSIISTIIVLVTQNLIKPIKGSIMIDNIQACNLNISTCEAGDFSTVILPHSDRSNTEFPTRQWIYKTSFETQPDPEISLYLPQFSESISLSINGHIIANTPDFYSQQSRRWSRPEIYPIAGEFLRTGENEIEIKLSGYNLMGSDMFPIFIGPDHIVRPYYNFRFWMTIGVAKMNLVLIFIISVWLCSHSLNQRHATTYKWLILGNCIGLIMAACFAFETLGISFQTRVSFLIISIQAFAYAILKFYSNYIHRPKGRIEQIFLVLLFLNIALNFLPPFQNLGTARLISIILIMVTGFVVPAMVWAFRRQVARSIFGVMFYAYCINASLFTHSAIYAVFPDRFTSFTVLPFNIVFYLITILWLIWKQYAQALETSETLTLTLQNRIDEKTKELEASYVALAETQKQQTLDKERQRIMMDLHDGIGGHLVNTIAYMENSDIQDDNLKAALETALRDLGFMIDSLDNTDNVSTLLGMYRSRTEALLERHGIRFNWKIVESPQIPSPGPTSNLNLLRIIQEAVTNSIKHANADEITVQTNHNSVQLSDNGIGFDQDKVVVNNGNHRGVGLKSMQKRAQAIGANFEIHSDCNGTHISLTWG